MYAVKLLVLAIIGLAVGAAMAGVYNQLEADEARRLKVLPFALAYLVGTVAFKVASDASAMVVRK